MPSEGDLTTVITQLAADEGLGAADIAAALGLDEGLVRMVLAGEASSERVVRTTRGERAVAAAVPEIVSDSDYARVRAAYYDLMLNDPNTPAGVKERGLRWLMDEKKGRNETKNAPPGINVNILRLNDRLVELNARREQLLKAVVEVGANEPARAA